VIVYFVNIANNFSHLFIEAGVPVLIPFNEIDGVGGYFKEEGRSKVFLDSGAFSSYKRGLSIDLEEYERFIVEHLSDIEVYAALDVIGNPEATRRNVELMESHGLRPMPTFHFGSPDSELERLLDKYDYIALGGVAILGSRKRLLQAWLDKCFSSVIRRKGKKVHGFGIMARWAWERYPFYSVDGSSWCVPGKYRTLKGVGGKGIHTKKSQTLMGHFLRHRSYKFVDSLLIDDIRKRRDMVTALWKSRGVQWQ
jgi:hypothetical protein